MTDADMAERAGAGASPAWTPRQRQVLDLLVRGRTNAEIAADLGISLDGAKWHLREILAKLDVDTREEAADYWRREHRMPARLWRLRGGIAAFLASRVGRFAAGTIGIGAMVAAIAVVAWAVRGGETSEPAAPESPTPTSPASASLTGTPTPAGATPTPVASASLTSYNGVPVYELVPADPVSLPASSVLYYTETCGVCIDAPLIRLRQYASGDWVREPLLTADEPGLPHGYPLGIVAGPEGRFAATWCIIGERGCGKTHSEVPDTTPRGVAVSDDGGVSWRLITGEPLSRFDGVAAYDGTTTLIVVVSTPADDGSLFQEYREYPAGREVAAPVGTNVILPGYELLRETLAPLVLSNENDALYALTRSGAAPSSYVVFPGGWLMVSAAVSPTQLVGWAERNPKAYVVNPPREVGGFDRLPVLVDLERQTIAPLADLQPSVEFDSIYPVGWAQGPYLAVVSAGDCLNVRAEADPWGTVLGCFADGVLLGDGSATSEAGGRTWRAVTTPDGREGWAAADFLAE